MLKLFKNLRKEEWALALLSLRKGDVTAKYSTSQVLALLMDVNRHNADAVVNRLLGKYRREAGKKEMRVIYDIEQLLASEEVG